MTVLPSGTSSLTTTSTTSPTGRRTTIRPSATARGTAGGHHVTDRAAAGTLLLYDDLLVLVTVCWEPLEFVIPVFIVKDTAPTEIYTYDLAVPGSSVAAPQSAGDHVTVSPRSIVVLSD